MRNKLLAPVLTSVALLLSACGIDSDNAHKDKEHEVVFLKEETLEGLNYSIESRYITDKDNVKEWTFEKGSTIKLVGKIHNSNSEDITFGGNPCDGELTISLTHNGEKVEGKGDVSPDMCIEPYVEHTVMSGETIVAQAEFDTKELEIGEYEATIHYANLKLSTIIHIVEN